MDTQDYTEAVFTFEEYSEDKAELLMAFLGDLGFDSFMEEAPVLKAYIQTSDFNEKSLEATLASVPVSGLSWSAHKMPTQNWNAAWENEGFTPIVVDNDVTVRAASTQSDAKTDSPSGSTPTRFTIELNPQMAFGTGHHDTTYMMMQTMIASEEQIRGHRVIDLGCGTAVLAILADKLGASSTEAIDIDAVAARSAEANVKINGANVHVQCGDASLLKAPCDVLLANIHRNIIIADLDKYAAVIPQGGLLLISGFYESDIEDILQAANAHGFTLESKRTRSGWACLKVKRLL